MKNRIRSLVVAAALAAPTLPALHVFAATQMADKADTEGGGESGAAGSGGSKKSGKKKSKKGGGGEAGSGGSP